MFYEMLYSFGRGFSGITKDLTHQIPKYVFQFSLVHRVSKKRAPDVWSTMEQKPFAWFSKYFEYSTT